MAEYRFQVKTASGTRQGVYDPLPDKCPLCHTGIAPRVVSGGAKDGGGSIAAQQVTAVLQCPILSCQELFLAYYIPTGGSHRQGGDLYRLEGCAPLLPHKVVVPEHVEQMSPSFVEIYTQA